MSSSVVWVVYIHGVAIHGLHTWCSHPWSTYMDGYHDENMLGPMASRVEYEDGGTMVLQRADLLQQLVLERSLPLQISKRFGDGKWYKGALTKVLADGTQFRVEYTDGDVELQSRSQVRGGFPDCCAGPVSSGAPKWEFPFWSRTRPAAAAASDFCGGLLNRLTGSRWAAESASQAGGRVGGWGVCLCGGGRAGETPSRMHLAATDPGAAGIRSWRCSRTPPRHRRRLLPPLLVSEHPRWKRGWWCWRGVVWGCGPWRSSSERVACARTWT
jgi:hypothetical protein